MQKITVTSTQDFSKKSPLPKAMKFTGNVDGEDKTQCTFFIVYFTEFRKGYVIDRGDSHYELFHYSDRWAMDQFSDFRGKVEMVFE